MKKILILSLLLFSVFSASTELRSQDLVGHVQYYVQLGEDFFPFEGSTYFDNRSYVFTYKQSEESLWHIEKNYVNQKVFTDPTGHQVIMKDFNKGELIVRDFCRESKPIYYKDSPGFNWQILGEEKTIDGLSCRLAKTSYRGREYKAWFTMEIPTKAGPWKFNGLPGLIIRLTDSTGEVNIQLKKFEYTKSDYSLPDLAGADWIEVGDFYNCLDSSWEAKAKKSRAAFAQMRAENPGLTIKVKEAKKRPATELEYE